MSRVLPADVAAQVRPVPSDFNPTFEDRGTHLQWSATLDVHGGVLIDVELGISKQREDIAASTASLRDSAWQATELARIGRGDLLKHASVGRHKRA